MQRPLRGQLIGGLLLLAVGVAQSASPLTFPLDIKFETNKAVIQSGADNDKEFERLKSQLKSAPYSKVEIQGYADATGPGSLNQRLSQERAEAVRQRLIQKEGIPADRVIAMGMGEETAPFSNSTSAERSKNRRVIARIVRIEEGKTQAPGTHIN